ncbi:STAS domain-containing protein [[Actinomadura] parvosata]|uniref:STAS domain-containing protein n=1 Tax=[Actinomadura] parvosata TaxID=1955412 RepID=UPI00406D10D3
MDETNAKKGAVERFTVSVGRHASVIVACAAGELDYESAGRLQYQVVEAWSATPSAALVLDLSGLTFCDSRCVGVLVYLLKHSRDQGSVLVLSGLPAHLERQLLVLGLRSVFRVEPSVDEAIEVVKGLSPGA